MFYRLKHYQGLLNLDKFTRIEKYDEEFYKIVKKPSAGINKSISEPTVTYCIKFYTPEGYGGYSSSIEYKDELSRNEDFDIISCLICQNKSQNFDIIKEQQVISDYYKELQEYAGEIKTIVDYLKNSKGKFKK